MKKEHIHKYMRVRLGKHYIVYKCMVPACTHYIRRELVVGRQSVCWKCEEIMTMTMKSATLKKPHHAGCKRDSNATALGKEKS